MTENRYTCRAPSNIAFLKYWGKTDAKKQWPANDSLSMTLANCFTETTASLSGRSDAFSLNGKSIDLNSDSESLGKKLRLLKNEFAISAPIKIVSQNSFPTGCGIASSASGMAALVIATAMARFQTNDWDKLAEHGYDLNRLSDLARQLSGSACRSFWPGYVTWIRSDSPEKQYATPIESDWKLCDSIMIFNSGKKKISSSEGHLLADSSPLFAVRQSGLYERSERMMDALELQDLALLGLEIEADAIEMHAVMQTSSPATNYLTADTIKGIEWIRSLRRQENLAVYFTIDAGPNLHLIYEPETKARLSTLLKRDWPELHVIHDHLGHGPQIVELNHSDGDLFGSSIKIY